MPLVIGAAPGPVVHVLPHGATIQRLEVECGDGTRRNVVLGHPTPADYLASVDYVGGSIGRYANRIAGGRFDLDGREVRVGAAARGGHHLHGGPDGFDRRTWEVVEHGGSVLALRLVSPDGDQGFPGEVTVTARFEVDGHRVRVAYRATCDADTVIALTNHSYFNLGGGGSIDDHLLSVAADHYTPTDDTGIPLGEHATVAGTPFDLRRPAPLGAVVRDPHPQLAHSPGLDHNFVLTGSGLRDVATLTCPRTRTRMTLETDQAGLQVYSGNAFDGRRRSPAGSAHRQGEGIALEPQVFPDTPHHPEWPTAVLRSGDTYLNTLSWTFTRVDEEP